MQRKKINVESSFFQQKRDEVGSKIEAEARVHVGAEGVLQRPPRHPQDKPEGVHVPLVS